MPSEHPLARHAAAGSLPKPGVLPVRLTRGLHIVSIFEAAKGLLVLAAGVGALSLLNRDASLIAEKLVRYLLLNPDGHLVHYLVERAGHITNRQLLITAIVAVLYSGTRFVEAYGLWKNRAWAEWMAVFGGMVYLPFEITAILHRATILRFSLLAINIVIVVYVSRVLWVKRLSKTRATPKNHPSPA